MKLTNGGLFGRMLTILLAGLWLGGCSNSHEDAAPEGSALTVTSYNMGLALNFVPNAKERLVSNVALLEDYDVDVICFQEIWLEEDVKAVEDALVERYPHIYTVPAEQVFSESAACTTEEISGFETCARAQCDALTGSELVSCATAQCSGNFADLSDGCFSGLIGTVGTPGISIDAVVEQVTQPAGIFAYDGSLGLMLASKYPLQNREFQDFIDDSSGNHRGALYADIAVGSEEVVVGCSHPTANLSIPYPGTGKHGSWEGENRFMQEQMIAYSNNKAGTRPILFAGDFNCSLANASNGVDTEFGANCQLWLDDGFLDPAAEQLPCSFCYDENLILIEAGEGGGNTLLDHVFVKNIPNAQAINAERVFDDTVAIEALVPPSELQPENSPLLTHPSDHFGVELSVPLP